MQVPGAAADAELRAAATSGLMALVGSPDGPPLSPPLGLVGGLERVTAEVRRWSAATGREVAPDWGELLTVRASLFGLRRQGQVSANGTCRLLPAADGFVAMNMPRVEDEAAVAAIVEHPLAGAPWDELASFVRGRSGAEAVARARLLGLAATPLEESSSVVPCTVEQRWQAATPRPIADLRIVDLSSMWAGPLAAHLLTESGGQVVKVESATRPDGARAEAAFYRSLHRPDQSVVTLDLASARDRERLRQLVAEADVVIESSRPRALEQLGAGPDSASGPAGKVWVSICGYGRGVPGRDWVAFGDDAAVAGGLVAWREDGQPVFCGDAIADPVTGLVAAAAALQAVATGGGVLLDVSMKASARSLVPERRSPSTPARRGAGRWEVTAGGVTLAVRDRAEGAQRDRYTTRPATTVASTTG